jgi:hypothetical protein
VTAGSNGTSHGPLPVDWLSPDIVHIGYPKVCSTFFQHKIFPELADQFLFLRKSEARFIDAEFQAGEAEVPERIASAREEGLRVLVSQENLAAEHFSDRLDLAGQLARAAPNARIVLFVRSQFSILRSAYFLASKAGYGGSYASYIRDVGERKYHYDRMLTAYRHIFGADRVHVVLFEDIRRDFQATLNTLLDFIAYRQTAPVKIPSEIVRRTPSDLIIDARRPANMIAARLGLGKQSRARLQTASLFLAYGLQEKLWRPIAGRAVNYRDYGSYRDRLRASYADANGRFFTLLGRDPADLDYPIA